MIFKNEKKCPACGGKLKKYDSVKRIIRTKERKTEQVKLQRLKCISCRKIHRELPDYIFPYKQYEAEIIRGVLEGFITCETNGFYINRTEFNREHVVYSRFSKFPKVDRYLNTGKLTQLRNDILVNMDFKRKTVAHHEDVYVSYNIEEYKYITRNRWDIWNDCPLMNASEFCYALRKVVNSHEARLSVVVKLLKEHPKVIIFYNFDYELELLKGLHYGDNVEVAEWNGHKHQPIPECENWVYLVQYNAGAEGWNCIKTDTIIFYSQNYSYKIMAQSSGRIDRLNTPYLDLYYYHLKSRSAIDIAIGRALKNKKQFNETGFYKGE